jgi:hypothetical protein
VQELLADPECTNVPMLAIESYSGLDFPAGSRIIDSVASPSAASFGGPNPTLWAIVELPADTDTVSEFLDTADIPLGGLDNPDAASPLTKLGATDVVGRQNDQGARYAGILDGSSVVYVLAVLEPAPELGAPRRKTIPYRTRSPLRSSRLQAASERADATCRDDEPHQDCGPGRDDD